MLESPDIMKKMCVFIFALILIVVIHVIMVREQNISMNAMIGNLKDMTRSRDGLWVISFTTRQDFSEAFDELAGKEVNIEIKKAYKKRSLDANAFAWVLINQIAEKLQEKEPKSGWTPIEVYRAAIRDVAGVVTIHCMPNDQVEQIVSDWESLGQGIQVEVFPSKVEGCTNGRFWKGSLLYNTAQMSALISILIQEAEGLGIPTITDEQAEKMLGQWGKKHEKHHSEG